MMNNDVITKEEVVEEVLEMKKLNIDICDISSNELVEGYLNNMNQYSSYCVDSMKEAWENKIKEIVLMTNESNKDGVLKVLNTFEITGELLRSTFNAIDEEDWIDIIYDLYNYDKEMAIIIPLVMRYSAKAVEFYDTVLFDDDILSSPEIVELYEERKREREIKKKK